MLFTVEASWNRHCFSAIYRIKRLFGSQNTAIHKLKKSLVLGELRNTFVVPSRYTAKLYLYRIADNGSGTDLTVHETSPSRRRIKTVCRISLLSIRKAEKLEGKSCSLSDVRKEKKPIYDYRPDLYPDESILILSDEGGVEVYICLAYDEKLFELLAPAEREDGENED